MDSFRSQDPKMPVHLPMGVHSSGNPDIHRRIPRPMEFHISTRALKYITPQEDRPR